MKRKLLATLVCGMIVFAFAACGSDSGSSDASDNQKETTEAAVEVVYYEECSTLPTLDGNVDGFNEYTRSEASGSSSSSISIGFGEDEVSSSSENSDFSVSYGYTIEVGNEKDAKETLDKYFKFVEDQGLTYAQQEDGTYVVKDEENSLARLTFESEDGSFKVEVELLTIDQDYIDQALEDDDFDDEE